MTAKLLVMAPDKNVEWKLNDSLCVAAVSMFLFIATYDEHIDPLILLVFFLLHDEGVVSFVVRYIRRIFPL